MQRTMTTLALASVCVSAAALLGSTTAQADASEDSYLTLLSEVGIHVDDSTAARQIQAGYAVCEALRGGASPTAVAFYIDVKNESATDEESAGLVKAAQEALCPETMLPGEQW